MNFYRTFKYFFWIKLILGLSSFKYDHSENKFGRTIFTDVQQCISFVIVTTLIVVNEYYFLTLQDTAFHKVELINYNITMMLSISTYFINLTLSKINNGRLIKFYNRITAMDEKLLKISYDLGYRQISKLIKSVVAGMLCLIVTIVGYFTIMERNFDTKYFMLITSFIYATASFETIDYLLTLKVLTNYFRLIGNELGRGRPECRRNRTVNTLVDYFYEVNAMREDINGIYGLKIVFTLLKNFYTVSSELFSTVFVRDSRNNGFIIVSSSIVVALNFINAILICVACDRVAELIKSTEVKVSRSFQLRHLTMLSNKLSYNQMHFKDISFNAIDLFILNRSTVFVFVGAIVTYFLILVQFRIEEPASTL